ncbi:sn-glycerol-3-phosphate ABC transporter permease UgpA [uncultured Mailhella sp.]|uniref:sn-glycerol-3-phosphate ABC transporter permease UgpA n=1 Tax=uncultured Mailhella sp. TaxID=1981031 RepID=UPI0025F80D5B|nr:sn-glycerol-3-phosphate ABC transporter permease UgpA [uncultured Mailhella sp.]
MQDERYAFRGKKHLLLPILFLLPQLVITVVFFFYPAGEALLGSVYMEDSFGLSREFVGLDNFAVLFSDPSYLETLYLTFIFSIATITLTMTVSLLMAVVADQVHVGGTLYKSMLIIPYAVAPPLAGVLWLFLFNPSVGVLSTLLDSLGYTWNHKLNGNQALLLLIISASWKQISYNFLFFLAGLQAIPRSLIEAAAIDGASPWQRFRNIIFPLLSPTTFFLLVVNTIYTLFETFGIVHAVTQGGPSRATETLIYKVFNDGFIGLDFGGSSAQSVVLMFIVMILTFLQFRYVERKVNY